MDQLLSKAGSTLVTFAFRSGVQVASTYVIKSVSTLVENVPEHQKRRLESKQNQLKYKIETVTCTIDMIYLMAARGNSNLESTLQLCNYLKDDINEFSSDIDIINSKANEKTLYIDTIRIIETKIDGLVKKIDNLIPLLNMVLMTHSMSSGSHFQDYVSPGRLLKATTMVIEANEKFISVKENQYIKVGPEFSLTFYDVFYNHSSELNNGNPITWREKYARCKFQIYRKPDKEMTYSYDLKIIEDFNDDRYHDDGEEKGENTFNIQLVSKLFFSASGKLLKLEDRATPVLVFKMRKNLQISEGDQAVDDDSMYHWIAFGDYEESVSSSDSEEDEGEEKDNGDSSDDDSYADAKSADLIEKIEVKAKEPAKHKSLKPSPLSLLEYLIRLCTLQANDQVSLLDSTDERLRLYLSDENYSNSVSLKLKSLTSKMEEMKL